MLHVWLWLELSDNILLISLSSNEPCLCWHNWIFSENFARGQNGTMRVYGRGVGAKCISIHWERTFTSAQLGWQFLDSWNVNFSKHKLNLVNSCLGDKCHHPHPEQTLQKLSAQYGFPHHTSWVHTYRKEFLYWLKSLPLSLSSPGMSTSWTYCLLFYNTKQTMKHTIFRRRINHSHAPFWKLGSLTCFPSLSFVCVQTYDEGSAIRMRLVHSRKYKLTTFL